MTRLSASMLLAAVLLPATAIAQEQTAEASDPATPSRFRSSEDGMFDISGFLDTASGFVPVVIPITEPAVGFGGALALVFVNKGKGGSAGFERPDLSAVAGMKTDNGSQGFLLADSRYWRDGGLRSTAVLFDADVNLRLYGPDVLDLQDPRSYALATRGGLIKAEYRIGESMSWLGVGYVLADTQASFDLLPGLPQLPDLEKQTRSAGLTLAYTHDTRNNVFTPTRGSYFDVSGVLFSEALGSDADFQRLSLTGIHYRPLSESLYLGVLGSVGLSYGDTPFYLIPFISMRGVPAMSYQGRQIGQLEAELRWQFVSRYSLLAFAGTGRAQDLFDRIDRERTATAGGVGFRYEIARKYGLQMGIDAALGPDGMAYYVQFGSAWMRP